MGMVPKSISDDTSIWASSSAEMKYYEVFETVSTMDYQGRGKHFNIEGATLEVK